MLPARVISRGFSAGNLAIKRCMKRPQAAGYKANSSDQEMYAGDKTKIADHRPLKKIKSHVYYSKKPMRQMCNDKKSESDEMEAQDAKQKCRSQSKIKSSSWKRSDKRGSYVKPWRKKSPSWIALQPTKQRSELCSPGRLPSSECRPGTLYSDVLFGAKSNLPKYEPLILFQKDELVVTPSPSAVGGGVNPKIRKKAHKRTIQRSKSITLEKCIKDVEVDEAFPPLLSTSHTSSKGTSKNRGTLRLKQRKTMKHSLKADHLLVNLNTANKANIFFFGQEDETTENSKSDDQEISNSAQDGSEVLSDCEEQPQSANELQAAEPESSVNPILNLAGVSEDSINQIAYGLYIKNQFQACRDDMMHFLESSSDHMKRSEEADGWKYKYLPIMNVKLFEDSDDEHGFGYSGYNVPKRSFLDYERGEQMFPRFSRHFDDDAYLSLERRAINRLESALSSSNV